MAGIVSTNRRKRRKSNSKSKTRNQQNLQKPSGVIGHRVKQVGGEKFAIVCVDPAKHRSEWMMSDYFGNLLIERQTLEHQAAFFKLAVAQIREAQQQHDIQDTIVVVERTGNYHLAPKRPYKKVTTLRFRSAVAELIQYQAPIGLTRHLYRPKRVFQVMTTGKEDDS